MSSIKSRLLKRLVIIQHLFCCREMSSSAAAAQAELTSLADFGYKFNTKGVLKQVDKNGDTTDDGFKFDVFPEHARNQARYEAMGRIINEEIYQLLETEGRLERVEVGGGRPKSFIFLSPEFSERSCVVLMIHGSGVVRAGQWARKLIINEDLNKGTMLPYIKFIMEQGWGVAVLNTNHNEDEKTDLSIPDNDDPEKHAHTVWEEIIKPCKAKKIVIISHSYGGVVTMDLASRQKKDFLERVSGVFMTDSVHLRLTGDSELDNKLEHVSKNYVTSDKDVGEALTSSRRGVGRFSAGHTVHEWTSWTARKEIFQDLRLAFSDSQSHSKDEL